MKNFLYNTGYFLKEAKKIIQLNWLSNIFSFLGTSLILFILGMVVSGWGISNRLVKMLQEEAEISAYFEKGMDTRKAEELIETIKDTEGVWDARLVGEAEAYIRMEKVLGEEARILSLFEGNPFEAYIEIRIHLNKMDDVLVKVKNLKGVDYVRDNREVLERIQNITEGLKFLGYLVFAAVGITTLVIISHMIRQGIYNNKDQINTLRLLGAPDSFIGFPFVLVGLLLTMGGGILAATMIAFLINRVYARMSGSLPFIPLPPRDELVFSLVILILTVSIILGLLGSIFGLTSIKNTGFKERKYIRKYAVKYM